MDLLHGISSLTHHSRAQRWLQRTMCVGFFMALFAGLFQASIYGTGDLDVVYVYEFIIKTLGCVLLACSANVLKTLFAKLLSNHFYRDSYFERCRTPLQGKPCTPSLNGKVNVLCQDCRSFLPSLAMFMSLVQPQVILSYTC